MYIHNQNHISHPNMNHIGFETLHHIGMNAFVGAPKRKTICWNAPFNSVNISCWKWNKMYSIRVCYSIPKLQIFLLDFSSLQSVGCSCSRTLLKMYIKVNRNQEKKKKNSSSNNNQLLQWNFSTPCSCMTISIWH